MARKERQGQNHLPGFILYDHHQGRIVVSALFSQFPDCVRTARTDIMTVEIDVIADDALDRAVQRAVEPRDRGGIESWRVKFCLTAALSDLAIRRLSPPHHRKRSHSSCSWANCCFQSGQRRRVSRSEQHECRASCVSASCVSRSSCLFPNRGPQGFSMPSLRFSLFLLACRTCADERFIFTAHLCGM